jgi:4-amino-4-deoxy-L-arabinose transferase-like glycosyltransferase
VNRKTTVLIVVLWAAVVIPGALLRGYWDPDEGRYGAVAREMWRGDGGVVPTLNGEVYREKPPLGFWLMAGAQMLSRGTSAPASRLPGVLATGITALLLLSLVRRSHGPGAGAVAAVVFLTAPLVVQMGFWLGLDSIATLFVTVAVFAQVRSLEPGARALPWRVLLYASLAATVLVKGAPVLIAVVALSGHAWQKRGWRGLFPRHLLWGVPLFAGLVALWAVPAANRLGWEYLRGLTLGQVETRVIEGTSHEQPLWYYLPLFAAFFLPWTLVLPGVIRASRRELRSEGPGRAETGRYLVWFLVCFVIFSAIPGKRERYILPLFVPAAALVGIAWARLHDSHRARSLLVVPLRVGLVLTALASLVAGAMALFPRSFFGEELTALPHLQAEEVAGGIASGAPIAVLGVLSVLLVVAEALIRRLKEAPVAPLTAAVAFLFVTVSAVGLPALDRAKSYEPLVRMARSYAPEEVEWGLLDLQPGPFCLALDSDDLLTFAGDRRKAQAAEELAGNPKRVLFMRESDRREIEESLGTPIVTIARRVVGSRELVAVRGR